MPAAFYSIYARHTINDVSTTPTMDGVVAPTTENNAFAKKTPENSAVRRKAQYFWVLASSSAEKKEMTPKYYEESTFFSEFAENAEILNRTRHFLSHQLPMPTQ